MGRAKSGWGSRELPSCRAWSKCVALMLVSLALLVTGCTPPSLASQLDQQPKPVRVVSAEPTLLTSQTPTPNPAPSPTPSSTLVPTPSATYSATPTATSVPVTTLLFTGVIVPARCVQAALDRIGDPNYPYEEVRELIASADLAIGTLNATMSDISPHTGCVRTYVLVGSSNNADALAWAGFDVMSVATNHIKNCGLTNCGDRPFFDTLENLQRVGILPVGAGSNHAQALQPVVLTIHGVRYGIVSLGQIEQMAFAGESTPGIAVLTEENIRLAIDATRQVSDVVIFMPHWGPEDVSRPTWIQRGLAEQIAAAGADLIVGNHTHVVQGLGVIGSVPVFYGLGNFVFDQDLRDHQQGVILKVFYQGTRYLGYELIPTHVDQDGRVHLAGPDESAEILERIETASKGLGK